MSVPKSDDAPYMDNEHGKKRPQFIATYLATLSAMTVGACLAWTSPTGPIMENKLLTKSESAWVSSIINIGGFIGALPAGFIVNKLGRKRTLLLINIPVIISWILICICVSRERSSSLTVWGLYFARFLGGLATGIISVAASMYISELSQNSIRGTLGTFYQLQITIGILYANVAGLLENVLSITILCCIIPFVFMGTFFWMPESPVYLLSINKKEEANKSLQWFRGVYNVEDELSRMQDELERSKENEGGFMDIVSDSVIVKALIIVLGLMVFQQLSGVNAVIFFTANIFQSAGSSLPPIHASIIIGVVQVVATYCSSLLIEKAGRRVLLLLSDIVMAICLAMLGFYFYLKDQKVELSSWSWLPLLSLAIFIIVFSLGYGPIPWIIMGELVPSNIKGISSALAACTSWLLSFIVTKNFSKFVDIFGSGYTFWIFSAICIMGAIFVGILLPETKGKDIQDILEELGKKKSSNINLETSKPQP
ncbi:facilitated trehalose transporter Tret1-like [Lycorma delicatula]|uniref:facilitated trehalose transporter Tret1-like n=1 Tax=Lycorma delicatula TaxID=130591 RepID=UPI003F5116AD